MLKLDLPRGEYAAYLFDCDGTIVDSMPLHLEAWTEALAEWDCPFDEELFYAWGGRPVADIIATLNQMHGLEMPVEEVARRKEELYYAAFARLQGVPEVLEHIHARHGSIPFAVVSGSTRESVTASLEKLGLLDRFETMVCAGDYERAKPDPQAFLMAAERLGVPPQDCLVFEDTDLGIQAATAAGMRSVKVPPPSARAAVGK